MDEYDLAEIVRHVIKLDALLIATETLVQRNETEASTVNSQPQRIDRLPYSAGARRPHLEPIPFDCTCIPYPLNHQSCRTLYALPMAT
jgi:hypothetical protein